MQDQPVTSPELKTPSDVVKTEKAFSGAMTLDLTDKQIAQCMRIVQRVHGKHRKIFVQKFGRPGFTIDDALKAVSEFEDEIKTELAEKVNVLVTVDSVPLLEGQPMQIEWLGVLPGGSLHQYGQDHEQKEWEVKKANERGEDYLGQGKNH